MSVLYILLCDCFITLKKINMIYIITCQVCWHVMLPMYVVIFFFKCSMYSIILCCYKDKISNVEWNKGYIACDVELLPCYVYCYIACYITFKSSAPCQCPPPPLPPIHLRAGFICKLPRSIIGNNGPIITYYRPSNNG